MKFKPHDLTHLSTYIHRGYVKARLTSHPTPSRAILLLPGGSAARIAAGSVPTAQARLLAV